MFVGPQKYPMPSGANARFFRGSFLASGFFSEEKVSEVRERASILEVVSAYVSLKKTGRNYKGLCPFHSEKTPSFMVNEEKQIFHCFGCGEGGDVFAFLMKISHLTFPQAVEELATRYGVKLVPRELSPTQRRETAKREVLFQINEIASEYFHDLLTRRKEGEEARRYLSERGISGELIKEHRLGYSLDRWDGLVQHLREKKVPLELACELGLILPKKKEGWYDSFRGRVLFPILDPSSRVVGFGGRVIKEGHPKYINSPESSVYHKGEILYGLHVARRFIPEKDCVIISEGYLDLLTLHQCGLKHSVATLGTALTTQHIRTLKRYTKNLITVFDADPAGIQANLRSLPLFLDEEVWGKTIILPKGEDPDSFLRKGNLEVFEGMCERAIPLIDFFFEWMMKNNDMSSIENKVKVAKEGITLIGRIPEGIRRNFYMKTLAEKLGLQELLLHEMLRSPPKDGLMSKGDLKKRFAEEPYPKSEEMVVRLMVFHPEWIPMISKEGILREFQSSTLKRMAEDLQKVYEKGGKLSLPEVLGQSEEELKGRLCEFAFQEEISKEDQERILRDCIEKVRQRRWKTGEVDRLKKIIEAEKQGDQRGLEALLLEHQEKARRVKGFQKR